MKIRSYTLLTKLKEYQSTVFITILSTPVKFRGHHHSTIYNVYPSWPKILKAKNGILTCTCSTCTCGIVNMYTNFKNKINNNWSKYPAQWEHTTKYKHFTRNYPVGNYIFSVHSILNKITNRMHRINLQSSFE